MIKQFNTATTPLSTSTNTNSGGSDNTLLYLVVAGVAAWALWQFVIKPKMEKKPETEEAKTT